MGECPIKDKGETDFSDLSDSNLEKFVPPKPASSIPAIFRLFNSLRLRGPILDQLLLRELVFLQFEDSLLKYQGSFL